MTIFDGLNKRSGTVTRASALAGGAAAALLGVQALGATYHVEQVGDLTIRCSTVNSSHLDDEVAQRYGLERDSAFGVLSCSVQKTDDAGRLENVPMPITATYRLIGQAPRAVDDLKEILEEEQVSVVGSYRVTSPHPVHFDVTIEMPSEAIVVQFVDDNPDA